MIIIQNIVSISSKLFLRSSTEEEMSKSWWKVAEEKNMRENGGWKYIIVTKIFGLQIKR